MYGISLFSGYGGIDLAIREYCAPIIYCDIEPFSQAILVSRMDDGSIPFAPIWNDVTTLDGTKFRNLVDIIYGGFPCQDLSVAGKGAGLAGKRSGLFYEIIRLCEEASPTFIFLENVPAIRTRGSIQVQEALASIGYDTRWCTLSAAEVGANHKRERWFCLAIKRDISNTDSTELRIKPNRISECKDSTITRNNGTQEPVANTSSEGLEGQWITERVSERQLGTNSSSEDISDSDLQRQRRETTSTTQEDHKGIREDYWWTETSATNSDWWAAEPRVGRVVNGVKDRAHRIKALGNGVVPLQVKTAFEILMGIK